MVRLALAGLAVFSLAGAVAAEQDNGPALVDLFARTCAKRPALPSEMARIAAKLGFVSDGGAISADMERGVRIDILYSARLPKPDGKIGLTAYFEGPADGPTVTCAVSGTGVLAETLPHLIETSLSARQRAEKEPAGTRRLVSWRLGAADGSDALEMSAHREPPRRGSIQLTYRSQGVAAPERPVRATE
jgi:hypothetical protein